MAATFRGPFRAKKRFEPFTSWVEAPLPTLTDVGVGSDDVTETNAFGLTVDSAGTFYRNTLEGGTDGVNILPANSGGVSGDSLTFGAVANSGTKTYTSGSAFRGAMSARLLCPRSADTAQIGFNISAVDSAKIAFQFILQALPSVNDSHIVIFRTASTNGLIVRLDAANKVKVTTSGGTQLAIAPVALSATTEYRMEVVAWRGSTTSNGRFMIAYYLGDSTTAEWSFDSGFTVNVGVEQFTSLRIGKQSGTNTLDMLVDEIRAQEADGSATFLGPVGSPLATRAETGTGVDALSVSAAASLTDTSAGVDALTISASVPLSETSTGTDAISLGSTPIALSDAGSSSDDLVVTRAIALTDTGTGADAISETAAVPLSETSTSSDNVSVGSPVGLSEAGAGADALAVSAIIALSDTGTGPDALTVTGSLSLSESALSGDALGVQVAPAGTSDTSGSSDAISLRVSPPLQDSSTGNDSIAIVVTLAVSDTSASADAISLGSLPVSLSETSTSTDAIAIVVTVALTEVGHGTDALSAAIGILLQEVSSGADSIGVSTGSYGRMIGKASVQPNARGVATQGGASGRASATTTMAGNQTSTSKATGGTSGVGNMKG